MQKISIIIPAFDPDEKLLQTIADLRAVGFSDFIVVNDGSAPAYTRFFPEEAEGITLLSHAQNRGKGAALKTAFAYLCANRPEVIGAVSVDCDGQHKARDVLACAEKLSAAENTVVLGYRDFSRPDIPARSRFGNRATALVFRIFFGIRIKDTQTGLRGYPASAFAALCRIDGDRYEYETNLLLSLKSLGLSFVQVPIETVYLADNKSSHFRPLRDSVRIYALMLKFTAASLLSFLFEAALLWTLLKILHAGYGLQLSAARTAACVVIARACSSAFNFILNRRRVFRADAPLLPTLLRYYAVALPMMLLYSAATTLLKQLLGAATPFLITLLGAAVSTVLYIVSFRLQDTWVFRGRK